VMQTTTATRKATCTIVLSRSCFCVVAAPIRLWRPVECSVPACVGRLQAPAGGIGRVVPA
jgi:hypothetical protein